MIKLIPYAITVMLTLGIGWMGHTIQIDRLEAKHAAALRTQKLDMETRCRAAQKVTTEVSNALQDRLTDLNRRYAAARVRQSDCTVVYSPSAPAGHDAAARYQGLLRQNGVSAGDLLEFARDAESVGLQLDACQEFENRAGAAD